jgi:threonine dehydratase
MLRENTPIERYLVDGKEIFVKREDMFGSFPAPPLAKLRGARIVLQNLKQQGVTKIGVFDTRISKAGQGIAYLCKEMDLECLVGFPKLKDHDIAESHKIAESLGGKLHPLRAGRTAVCYAQFKKFVLEQNGYMLPLGLVCPETSHAVESISRAEAGRFNSIVLSAGTGVIASGVASGASTCNVFAISCGMSTERQWKRIQTLRPDKLLFNLTIVAPEYKYYDALDTSSCPFPTSPYYDMKAWVWLLKNYNKLVKPVLMWNIGW